MPVSIDEHLARGEEALAKFHNAEALAAFEAALDLAELPHQRALALDGVATIHFRNNEKNQALDLLDQATALCSPQGTTPADGQTAHALAQICYDRAIVLITLDREADAVATLEQSLDRFLDRVTNAVPLGSELKALRRLMANSLNMKGTSLLKLDRVQESLACSEETIRRFKDTDDIAVQRSVARAIRARARLLGYLGRQDKEVEGYDELFADFGASADHQISETVLTGLERKMNIYRDQEDFEIVIEVCDQVIDRYGTESYPPIADTVARTMVRRAVAFGRRGAHNKELAGYDTVVRLYGDSPDSALRLHGAKALMFKAVSLSDADEASAEMECYDEVIRRYGDDTDAEVRVVAADALIHKGLSLGAIAEDAAEDTGVREIDAEIACYDEVAERYGADESSVVQRAVAEALLHKAETLMEAGSTSGAAACLEILLRDYDAVEEEGMEEILKDARALQGEL